MFCQKNKIALAQYACVALFFALCLLHFLSQRPLWLDENSILDNIRKLSYSQLLGPLDHAQVFPRIYLIIIKFLSGFFNYHVLSLRMLPLISMIAAYFVWMRIYKKVLGESWQYILAILSLSCSYYFTYYASEFKPYSMDVLVVGVFCLFLMHQKKWERQAPSWGAYALMALMPLALFFSYAGFFVFWIAGYNLLFIIKVNKKAWPLLIIYSILSLVFLGLIYNFDLKHSWGSTAVMSYWDSYFLSSDSFYRFMESFWEGVRRLSTFWFGKEKIFIRSASFLIPVFVYAIVRHGFTPWGRKDRFRIFSIESLTAVLFSELFVFGILKKYPFTAGRITLFLAPFIFYGFVRAIHDLKRFKVLHYVFLGSYLVLLAAGALNSFKIYLGFYQ